MLCVVISVFSFFFFFKQKTAYEMRISDWSSDVCSSDLIAQLGLKRPVTVIRRDNGERYDLVCGQGRLEAYQALGQVEIPALIVEAGEEDSLVMSLVENLARRQHRAIDLLRDISGLKQRG